jgi:glycosyltransferase involved in cell wall biosynthesis
MNTAAGDPFARDFLFVQSTTELGGAERVLLNLFASSEELRRRSVIASLGFGDGDVPDRLRRLGAEVVDFPRARLREPAKVFRTLVALRRLVKDRSVKVVIGNGAHPQIVGGTLARLSGIKSVFLVNMIHAYPLWKNDVLDALALRAPCDLMLPNSAASLAPLRGLRPAVPSRVLHLGTPQIQVDPDTVAHVRAELCVPQGALLVGVFGRLQRWKGQDVFVEAAAEVARRRPDARFVVVGGSVFGLEREYFDGLRRRAAELHLDQRLTFTGFRSDVPSLLAACDVVCHTTRVAEPFGMVIIEAMTLGRPVIATKGGGPSEIIEDRESGVLIPPDDPAALAAAIVALAVDPERRDRLGRAARERATTEFSSDRMSSGLLRELDQLCATV